MRKFILLNIMFLFLFKVTAQTPNIDWIKCFGGTDSDEGVVAKQTSDGGFIIIGNTSSTDGDVTDPSNSSDFWILKLNSSGTIQWQKTLGSLNTDSAYDIEQTSDGGYVFIGTVGNSNGDVIGNYGSQIWVVKLNSSGVITWQKTLGGTYEEIGYCIKQTSDGGYIIAGSNNSNDGDVTGNHGFIDAWIIKLNSTGILQWQKSYGGTEFDAAYNIKQTSDGGYIVAAYTGSNNGNITNFHGFYDVWILKLNSIGNLVWQKTLGGLGQDIANEIQITNDGGYIIAGGTGSYDGDVFGQHGGFDAWVVKMNSFGTIQWQKTIGGSSGDTSSSIKQTNDGGYIICGNTVSNDGDLTGNNINGDGWVFKLNSLGMIEWQKSIGEVYIDSFSSVQQTADGGFILAGTTASSNFEGVSTHGNNDYLIVKLSAETLANENFNNNALIIYPNPVTNFLMINSSSYTINNIKIIDLNGKTIEQLKYKSEAIDVSKLLPGIYTIELEIEGHNKLIQKIIKK